MSPSPHLLGQSRIAILTPFATYTPPCSHGLGFWPPNRVLARNRLEIGLRPLGRFARPGVFPVGTPSHDEFRARTRFRVHFRAEFAHGEERRGVTKGRGQCHIPKRLAASCRFAECDIVPVPLPPPLPLGPRSAGKRPTFWPPSRVLARNPVVFDSSEALPARKPQVGSIRHRSKRPPACQNAVWWPKNAHLPARRVPTADCTRGMASASGEKSPNSEEPSNRCRTF